MTSTTFLIDTRRPFRRADALRAGIAPAELRGVGFRRIFRGVYVDAVVVPSPRQRVEAALVAFPPVGVRQSHLGRAGTSGANSHPSRTSTYRWRRWVADLGMTAKDIYGTPGQTVQRGWRLVRARRLAGVPARLGDNWRPHFPDRRLPSMGRAVRSPHLRGSDHAAGRARTRVG